MFRSVSIGCRYIASTVLVLCASGGAIPPAEQSSALDSTIKARYVVRVERLETQKRSLYDTLEITLDSYGNTVAAYQLKVASVNPAVDIISILPGTLTDTCDWDYFVADRVDTRTIPDAPSSLWKVVALAKTFPDSTKPACVSFDRQVSLMRVVVATPPSRSVTDTIAPIFFYWQDCRDNGFSDASGNSLIYSTNVFDYFPVNIAEQSDVFPTRRGSPGQCIKPNVVNPPIRGIEFHNGGVVFRSTAVPAKADTLRSKN